MNNTEDIKADKGFEAILGGYLRFRNSADSPQSVHLDQDSLNAFVEGTLTTREATPIVSHLGDCSFCRHITSELVRLDLSFAETATGFSVASDEAPAKVSEVLSGLLSRLFGPSEAAVFAHHEKEDKDEEETNLDSEKKV